MIVEVSSLVVFCDEVALFSANKRKLSQPCGGTNVSKKPIMLSVVAHDSILLPFFIQKRKRVFPPLLLKIFIF